MLPKWDNKYSIHNFMIDEQHKKLFELANIADNMIGKQTDPMEIKKILVALFDYMKNHFKDEEAYMESIKFPLLDSHKEYHKEIISKMTLLVKNMKYNFKQQLAIIMEQWLMQHIIKEDMRIAEYQQEILEKNGNKKYDIFDFENNIEKSFMEIENSSQNNIENNLNINSSKAIKKGSILHIYSCMCGKIYNISDYIHKKIMEGKIIYCKNCNANITYINDMKV